MKYYTTLGYSLEPLSISDQLVLLALRSGGNWDKMAIQSLEKDGDGQPRFPGCSHIRDYEFVGKLGEGTFG